MMGMADKPLSAPTQRIQVPKGEAGIALPALGVEIVAVRLTVAHSMLDLRYRIIDPSKAGPMMDPKVPMHLIDPGTGEVMRIPMDEQVGTLRQSGVHIRPGQTLASLFANPRRALKKGDLVNLRVGDLEIDGLTLEG